MADPHTYTHTRYAYLRARDTDDMGAILSLIVNVMYVDSASSYSYI